MSKGLLSLELESPRLRREAFPWGAAEAELSANLFVTNSSHRKLVCLPSVCDLGTLLPQQACSAAGGTNGKDKTRVSLTIEIMGCDHGITFPLGKATLDIPLKLKPGLDQNSSRSDPFRVCVMDDTGARAGTLSGAFVARRRAVGISSRAVMDERKAGKDDASSPSTCVDNLGQANSSCVGGRDKAEAPKCNDEVFTDKAIELLEMASKLMVTASSSLGGRRRAQSLDVTEVTGGATQGDKHAEAPKTSQGAKVHEPRHDAQATPPGGPDTPATPSTIHLTGEQAIRVATTGFRFEPTTGSVDWQRIAAVNVAKVEREGDLQAIKQFLPEVAVGRVEADEIDANPGLINAFRLAQLQAQYVLHCEQVLQQQCNGLHAAVSSMELEIEGNLQGTIAMKERARFLRKESRKQRKIISGYAAMLRRHNPGLASKVSLDDKGRLKVFKVDEATRKWEKRERHRMRHKLGGRREIDGLQVFCTSRTTTRKSSLHHTDDSSDEYPSGSQRRGSVDNWPNAEESSKIVPVENIPDQLGATSGTSPGGREGPNAANDSSNRQNQGVGGGAKDLDENEACASGRGRFARASNDDNVGSLGNGGAYGGSADWGIQVNANEESDRKDEKRSTMAAGDSSRPTGRRVSDLPRDVLRGNESFQLGGVLESPRRDRGTGEEEGGARKDGCRVFESGVGDGAAAWTGRRDALQHREERAKDGQSDHGPPPEGAGGGREANSAGRKQASREEGSEYVGEFAAQNNTEGRKGTPRLVTVSVRPTPKPPFSAEVSDLPENPAHATTSGAKVGSEDEQDLPRTYSEKVEVIKNSERTRSGEVTDDPPQGIGVSKWARPDAKKDRDDTLSSLKISKAPVADASRLGLGEEDGFPDMSEFNLDDISDIDVGGEWGVAGGDGSLSS